MPRKISPEQYSECIRLRREEQLSTPMIARRVGLSNFSVYRILKWYPWTGTVVRSNTWTADDIHKLRELWPTADEPELTAAFPNRNFPSIGRKASELKIRRRLPGARKNSRFVHPLIKKLRDERERQNLTRPQLAAKAGYHWMQIHSWEMGKTKPVFNKLIDWIEALGLELSLRPIQPPTAAIEEPQQEESAPIKIRLPKSAVRSRQEHFTKIEMAFVERAFAEGRSAKDVARELHCTDRAIQARYAKLRDSAED